MNKLKSYVGAMADNYRSLPRGGKIAFWLLLPITLPLCLGAWVVVGVLAGLIAGIQVFMLDE